MFCFLSDSILLYSLKMNRKTKLGKGNSVPVRSNCNSATDRGQLWLKLIPPASHPSSRNRDRNRTEREGKAANLAAPSGGAPSSLVGGRSADGSDAGSKQERGAASEGARVLL